MPMISYRCPCCGSEDERFSHTRERAPESIECLSAVAAEPKTERIERRTVQPDGTEVIEYEIVELAPELTVCAGVMRQCESFPGQLWNRPARGFEPLVIYQSLSDPSKISVPGRNNEPTDAGYRRIEITSMSVYNHWVKRINESETSKMRDHREMHRAYWGARRTALRDDVNARIRHSPLLTSIARMVRSRSDRKTDARYGKPLDAHFHSQLMEFNQSNMQDWCDADTGWKSRRAR